MFKNVLVLSPHIDDGELGCGGTISKLSKTAKSVKYLAFSYADQDVLKKEMSASMKVLGIKNFEILGFKRRLFHKDRQKILDYLFKFAQKNTIDLILTPSTTDLHQDHQVVTNEAMRAFKRSTIWGYEMPWNNMILRANCFIALREKDVSKKLKSLKCYKSQIGQKDYFEEEFIRGVLRTRGVQIKTKYAEAFEVIKLVCLQ